MEGIRVIVCGGRDYADYVALSAFMGQFHRERPIKHLHHGNARGADIMAHGWAMSLNQSAAPGERRWISVHPCPANWKRDGNAAGPIRNKNMLGQKPDVVIAFPGGKGTAHMVKIARQAGVEVIEVPPTPRGGDE